MHTENLAFDTGTEDQVIHDVAAVLPGVDVTVLLHRLVVESVLHRNLSRLVVATQNRDVTWVLHLQAHQVLECFHRVVAAIDVVAHKDVGGLRDLSATVKEFEKVVELSMDVATNRDWGSYELAA